VPSIKDIPIEDLVAVKAYINEDFATIDDALRRVDMAKLEQLDAYIRVATSGLYQLPAYRGTVYRGATLSDEIAAKYVPGAIVREHAFVSTVANPAVRFPGNTTFVIASVNGRDVSTFSARREEREVVFFTGTLFKVLAVGVAPPSRQHTIYLAEIPDSRLLQPAPS